MEMLLDRITITGADDSIRPQELVALSEEFPLVEWGILFSGRRQGMPRYPSEDWLKDLRDCATTMKLSAHLCGRWVRDFVTEGQFTWVELSMPVSAIFQRVQLNFHGEYHRMSPDLPILLARKKWMFDFILQCDSVNDDVARVLANQGLIQPLFDLSGGAGIVPAEWLDAWPGIYCGYAGGLGPETLPEELPKIAARTKGQPFWIDMERRVRSEDDKVFDLVKVRQVLEMLKNA